MNRRTSEALEGAKRSQGSFSCGLGWLFGGVEMAEVQSVCATLHVATEPVGGELGRLALMAAHLL